MDISVLAIERWIHFLSGITWIGLLYFFNLVQGPAVAEATAEKDKGGPGPAAISKYIAPRALFWFRWSALVTWLSGVSYLMSSHIYLEAFTLQGQAAYIGMGAWLGTIMLLNVWGLIWPNQKKVLGIVQATDEEKAKARKIALMASRVNVMLSIPMLMFMGSASHGLPF